MKLSSVLEWVAIVFVSLVIAIGAIALLSGFFASRDQAGVSGSGTVPGATFRDLGDAHLSRGQPDPTYDSNPPTSGAHVPETVTTDDLAINNDQLLEALAQGNVVIMYGTKTPPADLVALAGSVAGRFSPALVASGDAVILAQRTGIPGLVGLAWTHLVQVSSAGDPLLKQFTQYWLGRGESGH